MKKILGSMVVILCCLGLSTAAIAQCATGVDTGGGGCVPPEALGVNGNQAAGNTDPLPAWESRWGAVVMDKGTGNTGVAENSASRSDAVARATHDCQSDGSRHCDVIAAFRNTCVAVSAADQYFGSSTNIDLDRARREAMESCSSHARSCSIMYASCSYPVRVR
ncbi:DUF4189 domain-containing protein [Bacillus sp. NP157]|nr:DUF4189 domain-containing protein [Bacillus sp. NP157]